MKIIPVIHVLNQEQVNRNIETILDCGLDSCFLVNHQVSAKAMLAIAEQAKGQYSGISLGLNCLDYTPLEMLQLKADYVDMVWTDQTIPNKWESWYEGSSKNPNKKVIFGGLAFKGQRQPKNLQQACKDCLITTDVACTSGSGTGIAAPVAKVREIHGYLEGHPLAIASGIDVSNIKDFSYYCDYALVASSITDPDTELIINGSLQTLIRNSWNYDDG